MEHDKYIQEAIKQAKKAFDKNEIPIGCVIVKDNKIISRSHNTKEKDNLSLSHAEINCIKKAEKKINSKYLNDCILYVTIEPCLMCVGAIIHARIKEVVYCYPNIKGGAIESSINVHNIKGLNHNFISTKLNYYPEVKKLLKNFFEK